MNRDSHPTAPVPFSRLRRCAEGRFSRFIALALGLILAPGFVLRAAAEGRQGAPGLLQQRSGEAQAVFRAESALVLVRFYASRKDRYLDDLRPEEIQILEDGVPQQVALLEGGSQTSRSIPVQVILLFDTSGSVMNLGLLNPLVFKENLLDGLDFASLAVYSFGSRLRRHAAATRDVELLKQALKEVGGAEKGGTLIPFEDARHTGQGGTLIYESIAQAARDASSAPGSATRLMVVFSDGLSTSTKAGPEQAIAAALESGMSLYPVALGHARILAQQAAARQSTDRTGKPSPGANARAAAADDREMEVMDFGSLAEATGGRSYDPRIADPMIIHRILQSLVQNVRAGYVTGYYPRAATAKNKPHRLQVKMISKERGKIHGGTRTVVY